MWHWAPSACARSRRGKIKREPCRPSIRLTSLSIPPDKLCRSESPRSWRSGRTCCWTDRKSTRLNSSHGYISYAVFCLKKKNANSQPNESSPPFGHALDGDPDALLHERNRLSVRSEQGRSDGVMIAPHHESK